MRVQEYVNESFVVKKERCALHMCEWNTGERWVKKMCNIEIYDNERMKCKTNKQMLTRHSTCQSRDHTSDSLIVIQGVYNTVTLRCWKGGFGLKKML